MEIKEITIPVPWGFIAAKVWGNETNLPVLVVHGKQDNAGSFDLLIPRLLNQYYYVCIDLPSHGQSSHLPAHVPITMHMFLISIKYVIEHFKWTRISVIAHSLGARIIQLYSLLHPELIERFVALDAITIDPTHPSNFSNKLNKDIHKLTKVFKKLQENSPPRYSYEEALMTVLEKRPTILCREGAINMLKRSLIPTEDGKFLFSMDQRLKCIYFFSMSSRNIASIIKHSAVKYEHLILIASETNNLKIFDDLEPILKEIKKNKKCRIKIVQGNHDVHNNNPELVAFYINKFLSQSYAKY